MRLLILTQVVDTEDPILGFFHAWIETFAQEVEHVEVVCLRKGKCAFPENVSVHSLGKEIGTLKIVRLWRFYYYLFSLRNQYDAVFVHMNPEYVVLGGIFWRSMHKKIGLWFTHKSVNWRVRMAAHLAHVIFTASKESFRFPSKKVCVTGHGIDVSLFVPEIALREITALRLISVGRISPIKKYELMFEALGVLRAKGIDATLTLVGEPVAEKDTVYAQSLREIVASKKLPVVFRGGVSHHKVPQALHEADIFLNCSETGGLDKALLEAWAAGLYVVTTNDGVITVAREIDVSLPITADPEKIAEKIGEWSKLTDAEKEAYREKARTYVAAAHGLSVLIHTIVTRLKEPLHG